MIEETLRNKIAEQVSELIKTGPCCPELKAEGAKWLEDAPSEAGDQALIKELREDLSPIDATIAFYESDAAAAIFGSREAADRAIEAEKKRKAAGEKYCDCAACTITAAILKELGELA